MNTLVDLIDMIDQPKGVHKVNIILFSASFPQLRVLQEISLESDNYDFSSAEYRVVAIILDIANYRLFKPVRSDVPVDLTQNFMKIKSMNNAQGRYFYISRSGALAPKFAPEIRVGTTNFARSGPSPPTC